MTYAYFARQLTPHICGRWHCTYRVWSPELAELTSQHPAESLRTYHTQKHACCGAERNLQAWYHEELPPILTGRSTWRFWLAIESWETWAPPLRLECIEETQHSGSSFGQSFSRSADLKFSSTSASPPIACLSVLPSSSGEKLRLHIPATQLPASTPMWTVTLCPLLCQFGACLSSNHSTPGILPLLPPWFKLDESHDR